MEGSDNLHVQPCADRRWRPRGTQIFEPWPASGGSGKGAVQHRAFCGERVQPLESGPAQKRYS